MKISTFTPKINYMSRKGECLLRGGSRGVGGVSRGRGIMGMFCWVWVLRGLGGAGRGDVVLGGQGAISQILQEIT